MNEKYKYLFLMYMYDLIDLKTYETKLEEKNIERLEYTENGEFFKYFSLLNDGDVSYLSDLEKQELEMLSLISLKELSENDELKNKVKDYIERTYKKYFFSNITGKDYLYYGPISYDYMAPDDAIVLGLNYRMFVDEKENESYEETLENQDEIIVRVINEIQELEAEKHNIKVAVIKQNEKVLANHSVTL